MKDGLVGEVDLWARLPASLGAPLQALQWAAGAGFSSLVIIDAGRRRRVQLDEGARALGLPLQTHFRAAVDLTTDAAWRCESSWGDRTVLGTIPQVRDLQRTARVLGRMARRGWLPVIVGPECNPEVRRHPELLRYLLQAGAGCCALAGSLTGLYGSGARWTASRIAWMGIMCRHWQPRRS